MRAAEDPDVLARVVDAGVALEVCPTSNVSLGVYSTLDEVPVRQLLDAGADVALGADDPLLFGSRLAGQYAVLRAAQHFTDDELATTGRHVDPALLRARTTSRRRRWPASTNGWRPNPAERTLRRRRWRRA